jgi:hypothetical protein
VKIEAKATQTLIYPNAPQNPYAQPIKLLVKNITQDQPAANVVLATTARLVLQPGNAMLVVLTSGELVATADSHPVYLEIEEVT